MRRRASTLGTLTIASLAALAVPTGAKEPEEAPERLAALRTKQGADGGGIATVSTATGSALAVLPLGVADRSWSVMYWTAAAGNETIVTASDPRTGTVLRQMSLPGSLALPVVVPGEPPEGLTTDGRTLILVDRAPDAGTSRFVIVDTSLDAPPSVVTLPGAFAFDATSPDAGSMYLIEHLGGQGSADYQVRLYDRTSGTLTADPIVDKREIGGVMEGRAVARATSADGQWVHTLYVRADGGSFVHQLQTVERYALCAGLPATVDTSDPEEMAAWRLAVRASDPPIAVNARLRAVVVMDLGESRATGTIPVSTGAGEVAISADGQAVYVSGPSGVATIVTATLEALGPDFPAPTLAGLAAATDGDWLVGVAADDADLVTFGIDGQGLTQPTTVQLADRVASLIPADLLALAEIPAEVARAAR